MAVFSAEATVMGLTVQFAPSSVQSKTVNAPSLEKVRRRYLVPEQLGRIHQPQCEGLMFRCL